MINKIQITKQIINYFDSIKSHKTVLIDCEHDIGRTYFVKNTIIPEIIKNELIKHKTSNKKYIPKIVLYISFNGVTSIEDVKNKLIQSTNKARSKIYAKITTIISSLFYVLFDYFEFLSLKNRIIIFDDIEKCSINLLDVFSFINDCSEKNDYKSIIVINEKQIDNLYSLSKVGKEFIYQKEKIALNQTDISIIENNLFYMQIKEKLIGLKITYETDMNLIYEDLATNLICNDELLQIIISSKDKLIDLFSNNMQFNFNSLQLALENFNTIGDTLLSCKFEDSFQKKLLKEVFDYYMIVFMKVKKDEILHLWDKDKVYGNVNVSNNPDKCDFKFGFIFIDKFIKDYNIDKKYIIEIANQYYENHKNNESLKTLQGWLLLEDFEVERKIDEVIINIKNNIQNKATYFNVIATFLVLKKIGFKIDIDYVVLEIKKTLSNVDSKDIFNNIDIIFDDEQEDEYNKYINQIIEVIDRNNDKSMINEVNTIFENDENFGYEFHIYVNKNIDNILINKRIFSIIDVNKLSGCLLKSNNYNIMNFTNALKIIYELDNLDDLIENDKANLQQFKYSIDNIINKNENNIIKTHLLNNLSNNIAKYIQNFKFDYVKLS